LRRTFLFVVLWLVAVSGLAQLSTGGASSLLFRDVASEAGVTVRHHPTPDKRYIMESMSSGLALLRLDKQAGPVQDPYRSRAPC
jgi:hypothetical protein